MKSWIIVGLVLSTFCVQVEGIRGQFFKGVGKILVSVVKPVFGVDKFENGKHYVETGIATFNGYLANILRNLETYVKNDIIPEYKKLVDSGTELAKRNLDMMIEITDSIQQVAKSIDRVLDTTTDLIIPETVQTLNTSRWMMIQFVNVTMGIQDRIGQTLNIVDHILELSIALIFMALGVVCGYELRRVGDVLRPRGFIAFEIYLLKWSRIICFVFGLLLVFHIILRVLGISIISLPERRLFFFCLYPILAVALYFAIILLVKLFKLLSIVFYYLYCFMKYLLYLPYNIVYYVFFAPFVFTYRCFIDRHNHPNGFPALVIYSMPVFFCVFYIVCKKILDTYLNATKNKSDCADYSLAWLYPLMKSDCADYSLAWLYPFMISYVLLHIIAIWLKFCYPPYVIPVFAPEVNQRPPLRQTRS